MQPTSFHQWIDNITMDLQGMRSYCNLTKRKPPWDIERRRRRWRWSDVIEQTTKKSVLPVSTNMGDEGGEWLSVELKGLERLAFLSRFAR
jgi:hypothetical protein